MEKNHLRKATSVIRKNTWYDAIITRNASGLTIRDFGGQEPKRRKVKIAI